MKRASLLATRTPQVRTRQHNLDIYASSFHLAFSEKTYVMGILNVTPDSFSDGGKFFDAQSAVRHGLEMARDGADIIDIGGESTRPGASDISVEEELDRVMPVIETLAKKVAVPISVDTRKSRVAEAAIKAGASIVNDVSGLRHDPEMASVVAEYGRPVILMHMRLTPRDMQSNPRYKDVVREVIQELEESLEIAKRSGVKEENCLIDPGIGFSKTPEHNLEILNRLDEFIVLGRPICVGTSRKSFLGRILKDADADDKLLGTVATCVIAIMKGASLLRVHDVKEVRKAAAVTDSILKEKII